MPEKVHHGRAVKRIREILHIKQEVLADALGISQQSVSLLETKETIEPETLEQIAKTLEVPVEAIKNFTEEKAINIISNNSFENCEQPASIFYNSTINPVDKWMDALEENKKLTAALLKEKDEKIALLEKLLAEKKK